MAIHKNYDPNTHVAVWFGHELRGFAEGVHLKTERNEDSVAVKVGARGDTIRQKKRNRTGMITVTLLRSSPTNDYFATKLAADEAEDAAVDAGVGAFFLKDLNGTTVASAAEAWVRKPADDEVGDEAENREWILECAELKFFPGGSIR